MLDNSRREILMGDSTGNEYNNTSLFLFYMILVVSGATSAAHGKVIGDSGRRFLLCNS